LWPSNKTKNVVSWRGYSKDKRCITLSLCRGTRTACHFRLYKNINSTFPANKLPDSSSEFIQNLVTWQTDIRLSNKFYVVNEFDNSHPPSQTHPVLTSLAPIHIWQTYFSQWILILYSCLHRHLPGSDLPWEFRRKNVHISFFPLSVLCSSHLTFFT
jgi:hypothetical protein